MLATDSHIFSIKQLKLCSNTFSNTDFGDRNESLTKAANNDICMQIEKMKEVYTCMLPGIGCKRSWGGGGGHV